jgi:hypothetical protein
MSGIHVRSQRCQPCSSTLHAVEVQGDQVRAHVPLHARRGLLRKASFGVHRRSTGASLEDVDRLRNMPMRRGPVNRVVMSVLETATLTGSEAANRPQQEAARTTVVTLDGAVKGRRPVRDRILVTAIEDQLSGQTSNRPRQAVRLSCRTTMCAKATKPAQLITFSELARHCQCDGPFNSLQRRLPQRHHSRHSRRHGRTPFRRIPSPRVRCRAWPALAIACSPPSPGSHFPTWSVSWSPEPCEAQSCCVALARRADLGTDSPRLCMLGQEAMGNVFYRT